jgi:uncharacterized membrane protein
MEIGILVIAIFVIAIMLQNPVKAEAKSQYDAATRASNAGDETSSMAHAGTGCVWTLVAMMIGVLAVLAVLSVATMVPPRGM